MPTAAVEVLHDDGRWYVAEVLDQYRDRVDGQWRVVVTYSTEPGSRYIRAEPADRCRAVDGQPPGWVDPRETRPDLSACVTSAGTATRRDQQGPW